MKNNIKTYIFLNILLFIYSLSGFFSKLASKYNFLDFRFIIFYGIVVLCLGIYAIGWQQIIKKLPLTTAFANKAITIIWSSLFGCLFFKESLSFGKILGALLVILGLIIYSTSEDGETHE